jgi:hypothetical protein
MELQKQVCSLELSKRLRELGFTQKSLFYWNEEMGTIHYDEAMKLKNVGCYYSAYTLTELGEEIIKSKNIVDRLDLNSLPKTLKPGESIDDGYKLFDLNYWAALLIYLKENNLI